MDQIDELRPNPDDLLASLKDEEESGRKGKLKIFFGMCAGVGKTYAMLQTAQAEKTKGADVIIGYVEAHKRPETTILTEGLETIPCKKTEYKGTYQEEMDLDAIIARNPNIVLVDELAHTNVPGSRHLKRYQDVQELLDNGINVYTTLNVQHLESRSDTVSQITGIMVRETLPDEIFEKADEVELADITPEELLGRLSEGKVYASDRSKEAVRNFFRKGNITALREMSLRIVADRVDRQLRDYMHQKKIVGPWKSGFHLMVVIGPSLQSGKLIRWAKNLSYTMGASLLALYIESSKQLNDQQKEQLTKNISLAKQLGAEFITTSGNDLVKAILSVAQKENISHIIIGKPRQRNPLSLLILGNLIQKLIRYSGNIDIYVLGSDVASDNEYMKYISMPIFTSSFNQYITSGLITLITCAVCLPLRSYVGYQSVSFILLFVVAILATFLGIGPILLSSTLSALIWNYLFIPPQFTFHISKPEDVLMFFMFFIIALLNGVLTSRVRKQERLTRDREERTNALYRLSYALVKANGLDETVEVAKKYIKQYFSADALFILQDGNNQLHHYKDEKKIVPLSNEAFSVAVWTFRNSKKAGKYTETLPLLENTFYPLLGTRIKPGVVMIQLTGRPSGEKEEFWNTFLAQISIAVEREFFNEMALRANLLDESDKLYKALFNSISHELRIPVSTIMGASDTLLENKYSDEAKTRLCQEIFKASQRLNRLIDNLLNMSRLESGHLTPHLDWCDVHDLVNKAAENLEDDLSTFNLHVVIDENMPLIKLDFGLMQQVLFNLLYNATQHAPSGTNIRVKIYYDQGYCIIQVMDRGPGFKQEVLPLIFKKFFRAEESKPGGTGLGLSIVQGFVEAHKGTVTAENRKNGGARFTIKIPTEISCIEAGQ
jgi:two-component system, OmpR family, sensor histidine kinase KdpD